MNLGEKPKKNEFAPFECVGNIIWIQIALIRLGASGFNTQYKFGDGRNTNSKQKRTIPVRENTNSETGEKLLNSPHSRGVGCLSKLPACDEAHAVVTHHAHLNREKTHILRKGKFYRIRPILVVITHHAHLNRGKTHILRKGKFYRIHPILVHWDTHLNRPHATGSIRFQRFPTTHSNL